ncbi:uncharacterized protein STEHIDRAFT_157545, partial [Stereum hirsutum FP-91666 SS1]|uniref:uncharacterized protein n=1 Tax=Stereum hirsutum (strain FP-91666) TaxID=721885 RepID=UPI0004449E1C
MARKAPLHLEHIRAHVGNVHGDTADAMAKHGATLPEVDDDSLPDPPPPPILAGSAGLAEVPLPMAKVTTNLPDPADKEEAGTSRQQKPAAMVSDDPDAHRGRAMKRAVQRAHLTELVEASRNPGPFWRKYRQLADAKPTIPDVPLEDLATEFESRMNPPQEPPPQFSSDLREANRILASLMPEVTEDMSDEQAFSSPITVVRSNGPKDHIKQHNLKSAK